MFRTSHIRTKLAVALAVPLAALVAVASFEVLAAIRQVDATWSQTQLASSSVGPGNLVERLQDERNHATVDLLGLSGSALLTVTSHAQARELVDGAVPALQQELASRGAAVADAFAPAWDALEDLADLRADVDAHSGPRDATNGAFADQVFTRYTAVIDALFDATSTVALSVDDASLRNGVEIVDAAARQHETRALLARRVLLGTLAGSPTGAALQEVAVLHDRAAALDEELARRSVGVYAGLADATFAEPAVQAFDRQVDAFLAGRTVDVAAVLSAVRTEPDTGYLGLRGRAVDALADEARGIEADAVARQRFFGGLALGALVLAAIVTWLASRSITRPLASLQAQADEMAETKLPAVVRRILDTPPGEDVVIPELEPIQVRSHDEVAEVAAALNAVQASAVELAVEQTVLRRNIADSYVNLGRRNQNLLSRQLDFITELERNEADPDTLEGLYRLDHLATRMRRNAESLLVLSGVEPPRQWSAPVKVADVVRAALGEVEDYQRVVVRHLEPASVTGAIASDLAHVLAELIENGLAFSSPDQPVEVKGRLDTHGYTLAVADNGLGMTTDELERANRRLAGKESFTVAPSRYLGHYVAGHLASRLGIVVELQDSPAGGVTARVDIPMSHLANDETDAHLVKLQAAERARAEAEAQAAAAPPPSAETPSEPAPAAAPVADAPPTPTPPERSLTASGLPRRPERAADPSPEVPQEPAQPTAVADAPAPPVEVAPADPVPALGFGGLAVTRPPGESMYSVAAHAARGESPLDDGDRTRAGLPRRIPGAQRPDGTFAREAPAEPVAPRHAARDGGRTSPEDVYSFLSSFQSGVTRGRADAQTDTDPSVEDDR